MKKMSRFQLIVVFLSVHILFAFAFRQFAFMSTVHALFTIAIGLYVAATSRNLRPVVLISAYIVGAELIWRMTGASVFWEFGKYAVIAIFVIVLLRKRHWQNAVLPIVFFLLLAISIPATISWYGFTTDAREAISFNLSGPLALAVCVLFFSQLKLRKKDLLDIAWIVSIPIVTILGLAVISTLTSTAIKFTTESNVATSGGFGPNQVSAILSLGAVLMFLAAVSEGDKRLKIIALMLFVLFITQSVLTFSRGGLYNAGFSILIALLHLIRNRRTRIWVFVSLVFISLVAIFIIYPAVDQFTGNMITARFADTDLSGRGEIALGEMQVWFDNLLFGVGPGVSAYENVKYTGFYAAAHTEYTRMLAEHGLFGVLALLLLIIMAFRAYFKAPNWYYRAWVAAMLVWPLVEMSHAAMRIAAIAFTFGLANANWESGLKEKANEEKISPVNR